MATRKKAKRRRQRNPHPSHVLETVIERLQKVLDDIDEVMGDDEPAYSKEEYKLREMFKHLYTSVGRSKHNAVEILRIHSKLYGGR